MPRPPAPNDALGRFSVRRTPRACHGACAHLRPGRLRASHAVCWRYSTLEPSLCARKEEADNESLSTAERIRSQSFPMRSLNQSIRTDSLHSSSASSTDFSDSFSHPLRSEQTPNNGAAENCSGRQRVSRWLLPAEPAAQPARHAPPPGAVRCSAIVSRYFVQFGVPRRETWNAMPTRGVKSERNRLSIEEVASHD